MSAARTLADVAPLVSGRFEIVAVGPRELAWRGQLASQDPVAEVGPHLRAVHEAAAGGGDVTVDVTGLTFVNSSGLRVFLDWAVWILAEPEARRYVVTFRTTRKVPWQAVSFPVIAMMGGAAVRVVAA